MEKATATGKYIKSRNVEGILGRIPKATTVSSVYPAMASRVEDSPEPESSDADEAEEDSPLGDRVDVIRDMLRSVSPTFRPLPRELNYFSLNKSRLAEELAAIEGPESPTPAEI